MWWIENIPLLARYRWVGKLFEAADKQHPAAYAVAFLCAAVCVFVVVAFVWQCWKIRTGSAASSGVLKMCFEAALAIALPAYLLCELVPRLLG